jgi:hypothetical protein
LPAALRHSRLQALVPVLLAATVFGFAAGSSSVAWVLRGAHDVRWAVLLVLCAAAAAWAWRAPLELPRATLALTGGFVALAFLSATWSVAPRTTVERSLSLAILLATAALLAAAPRRRLPDLERIVLGLLGGAAAVAVAGLVVLALSRSDAVAPSSYQVPSRFRGFGQNANTAALLFALAVPLALGVTLAARTRGRRLLGVVTLCLFCGSIVASGSRGGLLAAAVGALAPALAWSGRGRRAALALGGVTLFVLLGAGVGTLNKPDPLEPPKAQSPSAPAATKPPPEPRYLDAEGSYPLANEVGLPPPGGGQPLVRRSLFGASGRGRAWLGAFDVAERRPLLGFGFGTESRAFVDRYYGFRSNLPESSYLGVTLQVGALGLLAFLAAVGSLVASARTALRGPGRLLAAACLGAVLAGLANAVVQSYIYAVGNIGTATFWIAAFLLPALAKARTA